MKWIFACLLLANGHAGLLLHSPPAPRSAKRSLPAPSVERKKIERLVALRPHANPFPDYAIGSKHWSRDILGSFATYGDKHFGDKVFHKSSDASLDSLLIHFFASSTTELLKKRIVRPLAISETTPKRYLSLKHVTIHSKTPIFPLTRCRMPEVKALTAKRQLSNFRYPPLKAIPLTIGFQQKFLSTPPTVTLPAFLPFAKGHLLFEELPMPFRGVHSESYHFYTQDSAHRINRLHRFTNYQLSLLPSLKDLNTDSLSKEFHIEAKVFPAMKGDGYYFALYLRPKEPSLLPPIKEHVYFLIDRSSSIEKHRFEVFKNSVVSALHYLPEESKFHIIFFDQETEAASEQELTPDQASIDFVRRVVEKYEPRGSANFATLYSLLENIQEKAKATGELHTVFLLSNGYLMKNIRLHRETLDQFIKDRPQNFHIHTAAISDKNNIPMLQLLASLAGGEFFHTQTHSSFPRKFAVLIKKLAHPIALNIALHPLSEKVQFVHNLPFAPPLYRDKSYIFYGKAPTLSELNLFIQGYTGSRFFNIHKRVTLKNAPRGKTTYEKEFAIRKAHAAMAHFLNTSDQNALFEAKQLVEPFEVQLPFK